MKYGSIIVMEEHELRRSSAAVWSATERIYRPAEADEGRAGHLSAEWRR